MTKEEIKDYLVGLPAPEGMAKPELDKVANVAIEAGFNWFWGSHFWTFRMKDQNLTTVADQAYTELPENFEQAIKIRCEMSGRKTQIQLLPPERFDYEYPYPTDDSGGRPSYGKIVYMEGEKARVYWWRVPDSVYTMPLTYLIQGNLNLIDAIPSYAHHGLLSCIRHHAGLMSLGEAQYALDETIKNDGAVVGPASQVGMDEDIIMWEFLPSYNQGRRRDGSGIFVD